MSGHVTMAPGEPNPHCGEHGGMCAYRADDPSRCPWCHAVWATIMRSDWHTCEHTRTWGRAERWRAAAARHMRARAAERPRRGMSLSTAPEGEQVTERARASVSPLPGLSEGVTRGVA